MDEHRRSHALVAARLATGDSGANEHDDQCRGAVEAADLAALEAEGLLVRAGGQVSLTPDGEREADLLLRRYRLTEVLLSVVFRLDEHRASSVACAFEHDLRPDMTDALCTFLGHPATCPHGHPIPPGPCCAAGGTTLESPVVPLGQLAPGERARIAYVRPRIHQRLHRLTSLGLTPGTELELHQRRPVVCVRFEGTEVAFDRDVAEDILVVRLAREDGPVRGQDRA